MSRRPTSHALMDKFTFSMTILHAIPTKVLSSKSAVELVPFLLFISFLVIGVFGSCFVVYGQGQKFAGKLFCGGAKGTIFLLFVAVTGAISNAVQNTTFDAFGGKMLSLLIGGAIGGIVAFVGVLVSQEVEKLSPLRLTVMGGACVAMSVFGCFVVILAILEEL